MHSFAEHTTFRLGGEADQWLTHTDRRAWPDIVRAVRTRPFVLGGGSNLLPGDGRYLGTVVRMATRGTELRHSGDEQVDVTAQAGVPLGDLVTRTVAEGLSGIEYLTGIPGTVGAAPVQNAGAYGQQIGDHLVALTVWDWARARTDRMNTTACQLGYRTSVFKARPGRWTILDVTFRLTRSRRAAPVTYGHLASALDVPLGHRPPLAEGAAGVAADRQARGLSLPTGGPDARQAGSAFLNPVLDTASAARVSALGGQVYRDADGQQRASAGSLLELCGYSPGRRIGAGVYCSTARTLTVTARDGASATAVRGALRTMAQQVRDSAGVQLAPEPVCPHA